jgi:uncharacterized membrane protein YfcA
MSAWLASIDWQALLPFIAIGFAAQLVDGALGMAFGVISTTLLVSVMGVPPARASAGVHLVEVFTTGASGLSHIVLRNVDWRLFARIAIPGVIGGVAGAYFLSSLDGSVTRPLVMLYLMCLGFYILVKAILYPPQVSPNAGRYAVPLGLVGGFLDASGGGGWGPVVTSNLLVQGADVRRTVGTVNSAEFLVTSAISATFIANIGLEAFTIVTVGLLVGGLLAAPTGAVVARYMPVKTLMLLVGLALTATSLFSLYRAIA